MSFTTRSSQECLVPVNQRQCQFTRGPAGWAWSVEASSIASFTATRVSRHDQPYVYPSSPTTTSAEAPATYYRTNRSGVICTLLFHCLSSFILNRPLPLDLVVTSSACCPTSSISRAVPLPHICSCFFIYQHYVGSCTAFELQQWTRLGRVRCLLTMRAPRHMGQS